MKNFLKYATSISQEKAKEESEVIIPFLVEIQKLQLEYCNKIGFWIHTSEEYGYIKTINVSIFCANADLNQSFDFYGFETKEQLSLKLASMKECLKNLKF